MLGRERADDWTSYVGTVLRCSGTVGTYVWVVDVGYFTSRWKDARWIPPQGGLYVYRAAAEEKDVWDVGLTPLAEEITEAGLHEA